jgi:enolase-phosphatase E1
VIRAIVTDIEGTTSSLSFVKDILFPYARRALAGFVESHPEDRRVRALLDEARTLAGAGLSDAALVREMERWIDEDQKITPLKGLQGLIWEDGYARGEFTGHLYDDAARNLRRWHDQGLRLYVYSSGSVHAQKLLFGHSDHGDLTALFSGYFDTHIGAKVEAGSYHRIVRELALPAGEILFLSDVVAELDAAREAGMRTLWLVRDTDLNPEADHPQVPDFDAVSDWLTDA